MEICVRWSGILEECLVSLFCENLTTINYRTTILRSLVWHQCVITILWSEYVFRFTILWITNHHSMFSIQWSWLSGLSPVWSVHNLYSLTILRVNTPYTNFQFLMLLIFLSCGLFSVFYLLYYLYQTFDGTYISTVWTNVCNTL